MQKSKELIDKVKSYNKFSSIEPLSKAFNFAVEAHKNQKRISGAPYVVHPVAVADILAELTVGLSQGRHRGIAGEFGFESL